MMAKTIDISNNTRISGAQMPGTPAGSGTRAMGQIANQAPAAPPAGVPTISVAPVLPATTASAKPEPTRADPPSVLETMLTVAEVRALKALLSDPGADARAMEAVGTADGIRALIRIAGALEGLLSLGEGLIAEERGADRVAAQARNDART